MKKRPRPPAPKTSSVPRIAYFLLLLALAGLLSLLAAPRPDLRIRTLRSLLDTPAPDPNAPPADPDAPETPAPIRFATYNLENFTDGKDDAPDRTPALAAAHAALAADIVAEADPAVLFLEEVENADMLLLLNDRLPRPFPAAYLTRLRHSDGSPDKLNLGLLTRIPPLEVREIAFSRLPLGPARPTRGAIAARFRLAPGRQLLAYGIHLKSNFGDAPQNQAKRAIALHLLAIDAETQRLAHAPDQLGVVILGDTNVDPELDEFAADPSLLPLAGAYSDLWLGRPLEERTTLPARAAGDPALVFRPACFDRIFASRGLLEAPWRFAPPVAVQRGVATTDNLVKPGDQGHASDHHLVYADLLPE